MKKTISIALSFILLFASIGMAKSTHFCGGMEMLSEMSIKASHIDCGMEQKTPDCDSEEDHQTHFKSSCCDNEFEVMNMDEDFSFAKAGINLHLDFAVAFVYTFIFNGNIQETPIAEYSYYSPPILKQDHQVLFQTFLI
ncbi:hypothetical protein AAGF08_18180 [Algoriphagus sp. SE2]|uniref:HYC_CC_PP family protein n=1 Tax=Algoriphagus sp. SE2 TaxID=3141536 RepID=UPI0031CCDEBF